MADLLAAGATVLEAEPAVQHDNPVFEEAAHPEPACADEQPQEAPSPEACVSSGPATPGTPDGVTRAASDGGTAQSEAELCCRQLESSLLEPAAYERWADSTGWGQAEYAQLQELVGQLTGQVDDLRDENGRVEDEARRRSSQVDAARLAQLEMQQRLGQAGSQQGAGDAEAVAQRCEVLSVQLELALQERDVALDRGRKLSDQVQASREWDASAAEANSQRTADAAGAVAIGSEQEPGGQLIAEVLLLRQQLSAASAHGDALAGRLRGALAAGSHLRSLLVAQRSLAARELELERSASQQRAAQAEAEAAALRDDNQRMAAAAAQLERRLRDATAASGKAHGRLSGSDDGAEPGGAWQHQQLEQEEQRQQREELLDLQCELAGLARQAEAAEQARAAAEAAWRQADAHCGVLLARNAELCSRLREAELESQRAVDGLLVQLAAAREAEAEGRAALQEACTRLVEQQQAQMEQQEAAELLQARVQRLSGQAGAVAAAPGGAAVEAAVQQATAEPGESKTRRGWFR